MNVRKEKEKDFFVQHMDTFRAIGNPDPFFIIKTAFFQKGKFGRQVQFFESEIGKGTDIYLEFYDNVTDDKGAVTNVIPFSEDRQLFKYKYNPFYAEEYETKSGTNFKGEPYILYTVPVSEMIAVGRYFSQLLLFRTSRSKPSTSTLSKSMVLFLGKYSSKI